MSDWIDVSQPLAVGIPVWPGDRPFDYRLTWTIADSGAVNVGQLSMSTHTGTHMDAPLHFRENGMSIRDIDPDVCISRARVVHLPHTPIISPHELAGIDLTGAATLLVRTDAWPERGEFPQHIPVLAPELAPFLQLYGIRLVGVDLPSVDALDSADLPAHQALARACVHIVEGLVLTAIDPGLYDFVAVPLPIAAGDASPVRALVRPLIEDAL